jgi:dihydropyrimidine dehydrogenase (NAD+) subunit PreT
LDGPDFPEIKPALASEEALAEANRCLYCFDAPCIRACPTHIDVPAFIKKISSGNLRGSANAIFRANVLGASCARVCPTEVLCEGACVMHDLQKRPIEIGRLQRYATDWALVHGLPPFRPATHMRHELGQVAVVGAGPAGLACAAELLRQGVETTVFEASDSPGGLNATGVAEYKMTRKSALLEIETLTQAGLSIQLGTRVGADGQVTFAALEESYRAIFLGVGLGSVGHLGIPGDDLPGVVDAIDYIALLKANWVRAESLTKGRRIVVIGGGNTSIDVVTQAHRLGARSVTLLYRRGPGEMPAYPHEVALARASGCLFMYQTTVTRIARQDGENVLVLDLKGEQARIVADLVVLATGQKPHVELFAEIADLTLVDGQVVVNAEMRTSNPRYFAGGDCISGGQEVVHAVAQGKIAARSIVRLLEASEVHDG